MATPETVKVVLLGESGVGKTCIIAQFTSGQFDPDTVTSLSAQFISKIVDFEEGQKAIKFDIWDTAGQEKYRALAKIFYKDAKAIILVYDICDKNSFEQLKTYWYEMVNSNADKDAIIAIVANKNDLYEKAQVKDEEGEEFAKSVNAIFQSTSAKSDSGITQLFNNIGNKYFDPDFDYTAGNKKVKEEYQKKKEEQKQKKKEQPKGVKLTNQPAKKEGGKGKCC